MAMGDHLTVPHDPLALVMHHGIDCGDGQVVEYSKEHEGTIREVSLEEFAKGREIAFVRHRASLDSLDTVKRARSRVGEQAYDLFGNNCEHFATWCKTGRHESAQVDGVRNGAKIAAVAAATVGVLMLGAIFGRGRA
jgi:Lecithin retinol acyltransferase